MSDLISREAAIDAVRDYPDDLISQLTAIEDLPSAQSEITRCKDCKHYDGRPCGIVDWYNTADDFCSRAERRTDGSD